MRKGKLAPKQAHGAYPKTPHHTACLCKLGGKHHLGHLASPEKMPRRWVVERSFARLDKDKRLWKNCERLLNTGLQFIPLAFVALLLSRL